MTDISNPSPIIKSQGSLKKTLRKPESISLRGQMERKGHFRRSEGYFPCRAVEARLEQIGPTQAEKSVYSSFPFLLTVESLEMMLWRWRWHESFRLTALDNALHSRNRLLGQCCSRLLVKMDELNLNNESSTTESFDLLVFLSLFFYFPSVFLSLIFIPSFFFLIFPFSTLHF